MADYYDNLVAEYVTKICSQQYQEMFENAAKNQQTSLVGKEREMLATIPNVITWYEGKHRVEITERIRQYHLKWFNKWLIEYSACQPPYIVQTDQFSTVILHLTNVLFRIDRGDIIASDASRHDCEQIILTVKDALTKISELNPINIDEAAISFVEELLQLIFYFTVDTDLAIYLKNLDLVNLMDKLLQTSKDHTEIHFNIYRILAVIMTEADIKQLKNSHRIASVFITGIDNAIKGGEPTIERLHNSIRSFKGNNFRI